jgi:GNAT superfamily N-acetyltransferase/quercetin dioxygenase-like cupin family protein
MPVTALLSIEEEVSVVRKNAGVRLASPDQTFVVEPLFHSHGQFEMYRGFLQPGSSYHSEAHPAGVTEFVTVMSGRLVIEVDGTLYHLDEHDTIRFGGDRPHKYINPSPSLTVLHFVISYGPGPTGSVLFQKLTETKHPVFADERSEITMNPSLRIRSVHESDHDWIISLAERFTDFPLLPWRNRDEMLQANTRLIREMLQSPAPSSAVLVAEEEGRPLGFVYVARNRDFFTQVETAAILSIAVVKEAEGKGIGRFLLEAAEQWARQQGLRHIVLNVFSANERARRLYESMHYQEESVKMVKELN